MGSTDRKRRAGQGAPSAGKPAKRTLLAICPNCRRHVGSSDYILCAKCDTKVHLKCTEITTEDTMSQSPALIEFQCDDCHPPPVDENCVAMDADVEQGPSSATPADVILRVLLKEVGELRKSNASLVRQVAYLTAKVEELSVPREQPRATARSVQRSPQLRKRSVSSQRSSSRVAFNNSRPLPKQKSIPLAGGTIQHSWRSSRHSRRVLEIGERNSGSGRYFGALSNRSNRIKNSDVQPTPNAQQLPVARFQLSHKEVFVSRLDRCVTAAQVHAHLKDNGISALRVRKIQPHFATHSSFVVDVTKIDYNKMFSETIWATGTVIMDFKNRGAPLTVTEFFPTSA